MTPIVPVQQPTEAATFEQWQAFFTLVQAAKFFGGWHKEPMQHLVLLYLRKYPGSPDDTRRAEAHAELVRMRIHDKAMQGGR
jgi:hypothetical protein